MKKIKNKELAMHPKTEHDKLVAYYIPNVAKKLITESEKKQDEKSEKEIS